eukprot:CAMPEP_0180651982 /NCGR_PEP_ID=MMETSP1037_2-20121125/53220_1 /TAXON_ID=632150 /ORGANISM="Azadinium spinosum, Strain 3D9" /LENGTH=84 /DNA_ID=CAMNT_0022677757 /DNA_START=144 /DNA_END=394 /DNA_ORIENTATION=-
MAGCHRRVSGRKKTRDKTRSCVAVETLQKLLGEVLCICRWKLSDQDGIATAHCGNSVHVSMIVCPKPRNALDSCICGTLTAGLL